MLRKWYESRSSPRKYALPFYAWAALILVVSSIPGDQLPGVPVWNWDKMAHTFVYGVLGFLLYRYLVFFHNTPRSRAVWLTIAIGVSYGIVDEVHQLFIPNRSCTYQDVIADAVGVVIGAFISSKLFRRVNRRDGTSD